MIFHIFSRFFNIFINMLKYEVVLIFQMAENLLDLWIENPLYSNQFVMSPICHLLDWPWGQNPSRQDNILMIL